MSQESSLALQSRPQGEGAHRLTRIPHPASSARHATLHSSASLNASHFGLLRRHCCCAGVQPPNMYQNICRALIYRLRVQHAMVERIETGRLRGNTTGHTLGLCRSFKAHGQSCDSGAKRTVPGECRCESGVSAGLSHAKVIALRLAA